MANNIYLPPSPVIPGFLKITAITQAYPAVVTIQDSIYNTYILGQRVHLSIPQSYGMYQADQLSATILAINGLDLAINLDTLNFDAFVLPNPADVPTPVRFATLSPGGSQNIYNATIEPFQSLNGNTGN
jgi:hypothetical protein